MPSSSLGKRLLHQPQRGALLEPWVLRLQAMKPVRGDQARRKNSESDLLLPLQGHSQDDGSDKNPVNPANFVNPVIKR